MLHCWQDSVEEATKKYGFGSTEWAEAVNNPSTCMLEAGHNGPHEFTPDGQIVITFAAKERRHAQ